MQLSTRDDIDVPADVVWARVTDFASHERQALRRGAGLSRVDPGNVPGIGSAWDLKFPFRGTEREVRTEITGMDPPQRLTLKSTSGGIQGLGVIDVVALSRSQSRLAVSITLTGHGVTGRLLLQTLKLMRRRLDERLRNRMSAFAADMAARYNSGGGRA